MASLYKQQIVNYLKARTFKADRVLDVGGADTPIREYTSVEANRILILDNAHFEGVHVDFVHDLNQFAHPEEVFAIERDNQFDLIFCINVFEYIWNPYNAIANLYTWLKPGGRLVVNFPFLYPLHNPVGIDYLRYTHEWVHKMFKEQFKFKEVDIQILEATGGMRQLYDFYAAEKMHYRKDKSWVEIGCIVEAIK